MKHSLLFIALMFFAQLSFAGGPWDKLQYNQLETIKEGTGSRVAPFGEKGVYQITNVISIQSVWGTSTLRDIETVTGSGVISLDGGYIQLNTGTTTGSTVNLETASRGQYQPGKGTESGIGLYMITPPDSGTEKAEWGLGDGDNGVFWRYTDNNSDGDFELCVVYERGGSESIACDGDGEGAEKFTEGLGDFDPTAEAAIWVVRFNWYGVGGAEWVVYEADKTANGTLNEIKVHSFAPASGQAMNDPNLPIFAAADNGDGTTDIELEVGGRRFDVQGEFKPPFTETFERRTGVTVGTTYVPLICVRREADYPEAGRQNSVNAFITAFDPTVATEDTTIAFATVAASDLTSASFADPANYNDADTGLEYDTSSSAIANFTLISGGYTFEAAQGNRGVLSTEKGQRVPLIGSDATCAIAKTDANTATVDLTLRVREEK